jgi:hypothetical protein
MAEIKVGDVFYGNGVEGTIFPNTLSVSGGELREQYDHNTRELINDGDFDEIVAEGVPVFRIKYIVEEQIL